MIPLLGGSGGGGGKGANTLGTIGGSGGGALLLAASGTLTLNGSISARGGAGQVLTNEDCPSCNVGGAGGGSGGGWGSGGKGGKGAVTKTLSGEVDFVFVGASNYTALKKSGDLRVLGVAFDRSETRLEHAFLSFRASNDGMAPVALRQAKREVLRDRIRRYGDMMGRVRDTQGEFRMTQDIGFAVAFVIIFSAYAFPVAAGYQKLAVSTADSLVNTSLFRVAPVIILLSISKSTVALAQVANRRLRAMGK